MSFEVVEEHANDLLGRREAKLVVHHEGAGTPDRLTVRKLASEHFKTPVDRVFVRSIATRTGGSTATCIVEVYTDAKSAEIVPAYLKNRMLPRDQRVAKQKKEAEPKPAAAPPRPAAKKEEAKPAEKKEEAKPATGKEAKPTGKEEKPGAAKESKPTAKEAKPAKAEPKPKE